MLQVLQIQSSVGKSGIICVETFRWRNFYTYYFLHCTIHSIYLNVWCHKGNKREVKWQHLSGIEYKVSGWSHHNGIIQTTGQPAAFAFLFICLKTNKSFLFVCLFVCFLFVFVCFSATASVGAVLYCS